VKTQAGPGYLLIAAVVLFCLLNAVAVLVYPGGTVVQPHAERFLFWQNFLSDLGRTQTFAKVSNTPSRLFFIPAVMLISIALWIFLRGLFPRLILKERPRFARFFLLTVWVTTLARIGVGLTPWDRVGLLHLFFVQLTFLSGLALGGLLLQDAQEDGSLMNAEKAWLRLWVAAQGLYVVMLLVGPFLHIESQSSLFIAAGSQKILLLTECWVMLRLGYRREKKVPGGPGLMETFKK
jgi:hypothetical protein